MIKVLVKLPGCHIYADEIYGDIKSINGLLGGDIDVAPYKPNDVILTNDSAEEMGMSYNCRINGSDFYGPVVVAGFSDDGDFCDTSCVSVFVEQQIENETPSAMLYV